VLGHLKSKGRGKLFQILLHATENEVGCVGQLKKIMKDIECWVAEY
jgi:hypothetical protein